MQLALLGVDDLMLAVAAAAMRSQEDQIVMIDALARRAAEAAAIWPQARLTDDWNAMLDSQNVDAVLVAADEQATRVDQLRRLIQLGMPVLVSHPVSLSMLDCFELEMIREETKCVVLAYLPARWHPASAELGTILDAGQTSPIAAVEQITFERFLPQREREEVLRQFARDADLIRFIAGPALHAGARHAKQPGS
jgi:predicted dehydrogenase